MTTSSPEDKLTPNFHPSREDRAIPKSDYDSPWKEILELYLEEFFGFYFPSIHTEIDWSRPPISLDKELLKIYPDSEVSNRLADKLFQVWTLDGEPFDVIVNVEIQAQNDRSFAERVFIYNYRTFDRFRRPVVSVALLCDTDRNFHPKSFTACDLWGCRLHLDFPTAKLLEYNSRWNELERNPNPFAVVSMAHLKTQATHSQPEERFRWKIRLIRGLYDRGYSKRDVVSLFRFIDWIMSLPAELSHRVKETVREIETEKNVQYVTSIERLAGEEGMQKGMQKGMQEGIRKGESRLLKALLSSAFGRLPSQLEERLEQASPDEIERWAIRARTADSLDEVFER